MAGRLAGRVLGAAGLVPDGRVPGARAQCGAGDRDHHLAGPPARAVPPAVRPLITPITVAGVLVAGSLVLVHFGFQVFGSLFAVTRATSALPGCWSLSRDYFHAGFIAIGVLVAATRRQRAVAVGTRQMLVDLRSATPVVSPSAAAAAIVGDPTARVRYRGPDGGWIDTAGGGLDDIGPDRRLLPVIGRRRRGDRRPGGRRVDAGSAVAGRSGGQRHCRASRRTNGPPPWRMRVAGTSGRDPGRWSPPPTPGGSRSNGICTTAPSSCWSGWR